MSGANPTPAVVPASVSAWRAQFRFRLIVCALAGSAVWAVLARYVPSLPVPLKFFAAFFIFTFGPGALVAGWLTRALPKLERTVILMAVGMAAAPCLADLLSRVHVLILFPYVASACTAVALAMPEAEERSKRASDVAGMLLVATLALGTGAITFGHRLLITREGTTLFGDYDSVDLSYYAAITAELTHTNPPAAPFYAGHPLNYSYYPQLLLTLVHKFGDAPILQMYFQYAWPAFLALGALAALVFVRSIASAGVARLAVSLVLLGGDFSYVFVWLLRHDTYLFDWLLWPTNFLAPTMEVLHFSTWTPSLPVLFAGLYALARDEDASRFGWMALASFCFATLVEFKPFAFAMLMAGLSAAILFEPPDRRARARFVFVAGGSVAFAAPFLYQVVTLYAESRGHLALDYFLLPRTMLDKLDLTATFNRLAGTLVAEGTLHLAIVLIMATALFLLGGFGMRWLGVPAIIQALGGRRPEAPIWQMLAWTIAAGVAVPFVIVTEPYQDTLQFYQTALFLMWIFAARAVFEWTTGSRARRTGLIAATVALALPASVHYLVEKWGDGPNHPLVHLSRADIAVASYLRGLDPDRTVLLHDRPQDPSGVVILSERRVVLAWARYVTGSQSRQADVDWFFHSADGRAQEAFDILHRYNVTHVIDRPGRDRIHPDVLAKLRPVLRAPDVVLYEVGAPL